MSHTFKVLVIAGAFSSLLAGQAQAWTGDYHSKSDRHDSHKGDQVKLPRTAVSLNFGGVSFYYNDGYYYRRHGHHYYHTVPPIGVSVYHLPNGCRSFYRNGTHYYTYNNIYYQQVGDLYRVVEPVALEPVILQPTTRYIPAADQSIFKVNIPSNKGGYVKVVLRKSSDGFLGPQGEFYDDFPSVEQLRLMYGK